MLMEKVKVRWLCGMSRVPSGGYNSSYGVCFAHIIYCFKACNETNQIQTSWAILPYGLVRNSTFFQSFLSYFSIFHVTFKIFIFIYIYILDLGTVCFGFLIS